MASSKANLKIIAVRSVPGRPADARRVFPLYWTTWISQPAIDCPLCVVGSAYVVASAWVAAWNRCRAVCFKSKKCSTCRICCTCRIIGRWTGSRKCSKRGSKKCSKSKKCSTCGICVGGSGAKNAPSAGVTTPSQRIRVPNLSQRLLEFRALFIRDFW